MNRYTALVLTLGVLAMTSTSVDRPSASKKTPSAFESDPQRHGTGLINALPTRAAVESAVAEDESWRKFLAENPHLQTNLASLVNLLALNGYLEPAKKLVETMVATAPATGEVLELETLHALREVYLREGSPRKYAALIDSLPRSYLPKSDLIAEAVEFFANVGNFVLAHEMLARNLAQDPDNLQIRFSHGNLLATQGNNDAAISEYQLITAVSENPAAHFKLGKAYWAVGNVALAREAFEAAMRLSPGYVEDIAQVISPVTYAPAVLQSRVPE